MAMSNQHTRDWSVLFETEVLGYSNFDQACGLPEVDSLPNLYRFDARLQFPMECESFQEWYALVHQILKHHKLHNLIDSSVLRPFRDDQDAPKWQDLSLGVTRWLAWNMAPEDVAKIVDGRIDEQNTRLALELTLADDFMDGIKKLMFHEERPNMAECTSLLFRIMNIKRSNVKTLPHFVNLVWRLKCKAHAYSLNIHPFIMLSILLNGMKYDLPEFVAEQSAIMDQMINPTYEVTDKHFQDTLDAYEAYQRAQDKSGDSSDDSSDQEMGISSEEDVHDDNYEDADADDEGDADADDEGDADADNEEVTDPDTSIAEVVEAKLIQKYLKIGTKITQEK
jgi:hypothetical protein